MIKINIKKQLLTAHGIMPLSVDIEIGAGEFVSAFGESGAGKTSLLRMIAGLMTPDQGSIEVDGALWFDSDKKINLPVQRRSIGFVFQDYNLFPHMSVKENLLFALGPKQAPAIIDELLDAIHLKGYENRRPAFLSSGQRQRAALARAIIRQPKILLLDEPFSALDVDLRLRLQDELLNLHRRFKTTSLFVSHDIPEVFKLSEKIFILEKGRVIKSGAPENVFASYNVSGKFKFIGKILEIVPDGFMRIITLQIDNTVTKVVATDEESKNYKVGDRITVAAKAFNPIIL